MATPELPTRTDLETALGEGFEAMPETMRHRIWCRATQVFAAEQPLEGTDRARQVALAEARTRFEAWRRGEPA